MKQQKKILIISDDESINRLIDIVLSNLGYSVKFADNDETLKEQLQNNPPDMAIVDLGMKNADGMKLFSDIKLENQNLPIIMMTEKANEYISKPFNINELKLKIDRLFWKFEHLENKPKNPKGHQIIQPSMEFVHSGILELDELTGGGFLTGSNILLLGPVGSGKSSFCMKFIEAGLRNDEPCMYVAFDDNPIKLRNKLSSKMVEPIEGFELAGKLCFIDCYSWGASGLGLNEKFMLNTLSLINLNSLIADVGEYLGQNKKVKAGGRRVIDSLTGLLIEFDPVTLQRFLFNLTRSSEALGNVNTVFVLEAGTYDERVLNTISYLMDGIIEMKPGDDGSMLRIVNMKWTRYSKEWININL